MWKNGDLHWVNKEMSNICGNLLQKRQQNNEKDKDNNDNNDNKDNKQAANEGEPAAKKQKTEIEATS